MQHLGFRAQVPYAGGIPESNKPKKLEFWFWEAG